MILNFSFHRRLKFMNRKTFLCRSSSFHFHLAFRLQVESFVNKHNSVLSLPLPLWTHVCWWIIMQALSKNKTLFGFPSECESKLIRMVKSWDQHSSWSSEALMLAAAVAQIYHKIMFHTRLRFSWTLFGTFRQQTASNGHEMILICCLAECDSWMELRTTLACLLACLACCCLSQSFNRAIRKEFTAFVDLDIVAFFFARSPHHHHHTTGTCQFAAHKSKAFKFIKWTNERESLKSLRWRLRVWNFRSKISKVAISLARPMLIVCLLSSWLASDEPFN